VEAAGKPTLIGLHEARGVLLLDKIASWFVQTVLRKRNSVDGASDPVVADTRCRTHREEIEYRPTACGMIGESGHGPYGPQDVDGEVVLREGVVLGCGTLHRSHKLDCLDPIHNGV